MSDEYVTNELPGVGEIRARKGTSTAELAGAAAFWAKKYKSAWRDGFLSACVVIGLAGIVAGAAIHFVY